MQNLAPYACDPALSRGRLVPEAPCQTRSVYQRDRDRIVHSTAFRRLIHKTQVFVYHEGDHYRTRLTHSLEVAQIARTLARALSINEDLVETIALAHDLGHTPFGHAGEDALALAMRSVGGFDHNAQSLRIVTDLERRYAAFHGLNLTWETLEGLVKHNGPLTDAAGNPVGRYAKRGLPYAVQDYARKQDLRLDSFASLEAQVAAIADDIAYNNHDIDDGFRAGFITVAQLEEVELAANAMREVRARHGDLPDSQLVYEMNRRMIAAMVEDVLAEVRSGLKAAMPVHPDQIRALTYPLAMFSEGMAAKLAELREFLFARVYRHPFIASTVEGAQTIVVGLYEYFTHNPRQIPGQAAEIAAIADPVARDRAIGDFVAGMTDRYALQLFEKAFPSLPAAGAK
jgi:dGTPase